jgi:hypothetical protein
VAVVGSRVETRLRRHISGKEAHAYGPPGYETDSQFFAHIEHSIVFGRPFNERIFALDRCDRLNRVRATDRRDARFRQAEVQDLAFGDEVSNRPSYLLDRHVRIDTMLVEQVDTVSAQALKRRLGDLPDLLGIAEGCA